jgi:hypothetical protein
MKPSRVTNIIVLLAVVMASWFAYPGSAQADEADADPYVRSPVSAYTLEQPFGGVSSVKDIGEYIQLVYQFALGIVGIIAVVLIMLGGLRWVAAAGNESAIGEAKEIITSAVTGLVIALLSYTILFFINPQTLQTGVDIYKIPKPVACPIPTLVDIPDSPGLDGSGQDCPNYVTALQTAAKKMVTEPGPGYCPTCVIHVGSSYRTAEQQQPIYDCYLECVDKGYIDSDGDRLKSGNGACGYCPKAAPVCDSPHVKGLAADMYITVGGASEMKDATKTGEKQYNNGGSGGTVDYHSCGTGCDSGIFKAQKTMYDALTRDKLFSNYDEEWWHFDLAKKECGADSTTFCTNGSTSSSGETMAAEWYCETTVEGVDWFHLAYCTDSVVSCGTWADKTWSTVSYPSCANTTTSANYAVFSGSYLVSGQKDIYSHVPECHKSSTSTITGSKL